MSREGKLIDGKYRLLRPIGRGGMSMVYLAVDLKLRKEWAVKEVKKKGEGDRSEKVIQSLAAEVSLMKRLDHPALPRIVDVSEDAQNIYIVMDYIRGISLDRLLSRDGVQPEARVIGWGIQLCDALRYLHGQNPPVIYRDMKPANIMLTPEGNLKLIDFGIAREYKRRHLADTEVLGTRGYAPPEQHGTRQTDARSDIYALGMTLRHLLTGQDPRQPDYRHLPIRRCDPAFSEGMEQIIERCTAPDPKDRYQNCGELLYDLRHPREAGNGGTRKKRRRLKLRICLAVLAAAVAVSGGGSQILQIQENRRALEKKLRISASAPYERKVESYLEAIELSGSDPRGYILLLRTYREHGVFGNRESQQFLHAFDAHREELERESTEYLDLLYEAGITYFYLYSDERSGGENFADRVLKSYPYFREIVRTGNEQYRYYEIARSYGAIGQFYEQYMADAASVREPLLENYLELLDAVRSCLTGAEHYEGADSAYVKLTLYRAVIDLLNAHRKGFAVTGVEKEKVEEICRYISEKTETVSVTRQVSISLRDSILSDSEKYMENLDRVYENTDERVHPFPTG